MSPSIPSLPSPVMIDTPGDLAHLQQVMDTVSRLALDTESNSLFAYQEQVCLIQLSTDETDYLIDPLRLKSDLGFLRETFADQDIEKVFHAAEYDVMCLRRDFGFEFVNIFDTMIAARLLGWESFGLGNILKQRFGVKASKRFQRANWGERPLPPKLIQYAQLDTHYLLPLRDEFYATLGARGRLEEARELFSEVCRAQWNKPDFDPAGFWHLKGARELSPQDMSTLQALYLFRNQQARRRDLPVFKVMGDNTLLHLAVEKPRSIQEMQHIPGMSASQIRRYGDGILKAVRRGLESPPPVPPRSPRAPSETITRRFDALLDWRKERAAQRGISSDLVMPKVVLWEIAVVAPRTVEKLRETRNLGHWRFKTYGNEILRVLSDVDRRVKNNKRGKS